MVDKINSKILTQTEFNANTELKTQYKNYAEYFTEALSTTSAWTMAKKDGMIASESGTDDPIKGYYLEKAAAKDEAEANYYEAYNNFLSLKDTKSSASSDMKYASEVYGEDSAQYTEASESYTAANQSASTGETGWKIAMNRFNEANSSAFKAFLSSWAHG